MTTRTITRDCNKKAFKLVPTGEENDDTSDKSVFGTEESDQHKLFFQPLRRSERLRSRVSHLVNPNNSGSNLTNSSNQAEQLLMDVIMQSTSANAEMAEIKQQNNRLLVFVRAKNDEIQRLANILMEKIKYSGYWLITYRFKDNFLIPITRDIFLPDRFQYTRLEI